MRLADQRARVLAVRIGTLAQRSQFVPKKQNWFRSAQPWLAQLASIPRNEKQG